MEPNWAGMTSAEKNFLLYCMNSDSSCYHQRVVYFFAAFLDQPGITSNAPRRAVAEALQVRIPAHRAALRDFSLLRFVVALCKVFLFALL